MRDIEAFEADFDAHQEEYEAAAGRPYADLPPRNYLDEAEDLLEGDASWGKVRGLAFWLQAEDRREYEAEGHAHKA